jgi:hypothetical protein
MKKTYATTFIMLATLLWLTGCNSISGAASSKDSFSITVDSQASVVTAKPVNGMQLYLELNSATYQPGEVVMVTAGEWNTLTATNEAAAGRSWPVSGLAMGPCGVLNYPIGVALYSGYYTENDIFTATPLRLYDPKALYRCPVIVSSISSYVFQPSSDIADVYGSCDTGPCLDDLKIGGTLTYAGFWTDGQDSTFSNFTPGTYTVVCGDEWGTLILIHFIVLGG